MPIIAKQFSNRIEQQVWVAQTLTDLIQQNVKPSEIALIARKHEQLMDLVPVLAQFDIPVSYERGQAVLQRSEILELLTIIRYIDSHHQTDSEPRDDLLPEILSYKFWRIPSLEIYKLSQYAYKNRLSWLDGMRQIGNADLELIADFLIELAKLKQDTPVELIIDEITGVSKQNSIVEDTDSEYDPEMEEIVYKPEFGLLNVINATEMDREENHYLTRFVSAFKWYYFDAPQEKNDNGFVLFLSALKVFRDALRSFESDTRQHNQILKTSDLIKYVDLLQKRNVSLVDNSVYNSSKEAINLLTAHKSKGLEFEYVFVLECSESAWNGRGKVNKIGLPSNLPLLPQSNTSDDSLRLFYVSLTRAKTHLYLTHYQYDSSGNTLPSLSFLNEIVEFEDQKLESASLDRIQGLKQSDAQKLPDGILPLTIWFQSSVQDSLIRSEISEYLAPMLENYKLSVTHLNSFLDLVRGGPTKFIQQNILHFPQAKSPAAAYGTAMHASIKDFYSYFQSTQNLPTESYLIERFRLNLQSQRLVNKDYEDYFQKGSENLKLYYINRANFFSIKDRLEEDFNTQGVILGKVENGAKITGKIDKMIFNEQMQIEVVDFKTGKAHIKWTDSNLDTAVKLLNYRRQLVFYKLLVENSKDFNRYKVNSGSLEFLDVPFNDTRTTILNTEISDQETQELSKLIQVVYKKIIGLAHGSPLPDVSGYTPDLKGIDDFIQDLISE